MGLETVQPTKCKMWHLHERLGENINGESCSSLLRSIAAYGQRHPVVGRRIPEAQGYAIELIFGARRLFVAQQLATPLLVDIREIDDRTAVIEMEIENRVRADITPYERGLSYRRWISNGIFGNQCELARALGVSEAQVSRLVRYADIPAAVVAAFSSGGAIREEWAVALARECEERPSRDLLIRRARDRPRSGRADADQAVFDALTSGKRGRGAGAGRRAEVVRDSTGAPLFRVAYRVKAVHLIVPRQLATDAVVTRIANQMRATLEEVQAEGGARDDGARTNARVHRLRPNSEPLDRIGSGLPAIRPATG